MALNKIKLCAGCPQLFETEEKFSLEFMDLSDKYFFWQCPECKPKRGNADNTPVRPGNLISKQPDEGNVTRCKKGNIAVKQDLATSKKSPVTQEEVRSIVKSEIRDLMIHLNDTMTNFVNKELKSIKDELCSVKEPMKFMNEQYEDIKTEIKKKFDSVDSLYKENEQLKLTIQHLDTRLNIMEQQSRASNIELQCLPEYKNENLVNTVMNLSKIISCNINENNIHNVTRIAKQNPNSSRPKSIIVQFFSPRVRDSFLAASIKYNKNNPDEKLNSKLLGIGGPKENIYVVEHLSPRNKMLHASARQKAKLKGYRFVWVRNGKTFKRKSDNCEYKHIRGLGSLEKIE